MYWILLIEIDACFTSALIKCLLFWGLNELVVDSENVVKTLNDEISVAL